jgi:hypothetical protein
MKTKKYVNDQRLLFEEDKTFLMYEKDYLHSSFDVRHPSNNDNLALHKIEIWAETLDLYKRSYDKI